MRIHDGGLVRSRNRGVVVKLWKEFIEWDELASVTMLTPFSSSAPLPSAPPVDRHRHPDLYSLTQSAGVSDYHGIRCLVEEFAAGTPTRLILMPFTHCHRLVMNKVGKRSKLITVEANHPAGYIATAAAEFERITTLSHGEWYIRGRVTIGGVLCVLMTAQCLKFVRAANLSGDRLVLQGTGAVQQHFTTGCSRVESAITSLCCTGDHHAHPFLVNLTFGGTL